MESSKSTRALRNALADGNIDCEAPQSFKEQFDLLDKDKNGTLDRNEAYQLAQLWKIQKDTNAQLKGYIGGIIGVSTLIIVLLAGATFGATFVAVAANKETSVASSGSLMNKEGSRELSTVSHGHHIGVVKTSEDEPVCIHLNEFEDMKAGILSGERVVLDIETDGTGTHDVKIFDGQGASISENTTCYNIDDPSKELCFTKMDCGTETHRKLWESRGLSVERELHAISADHVHSAASCVNGWALRSGTCYYACHSFTAGSSYTDWDSYHNARRPVSNCCLAACGPAHPTCSGKSEAAC